MSSRLSTLDPQSVEVIRAFSDCLRLDLPESVAAAIVEVPAVVAAMFAKQLEVDHFAWGRTERTEQQHLAAGG